MPDEKPKKQMGCYQLVWLIHQGYELRVKSHFQQVGYFFKGNINQMSKQHRTNHILPPCGIFYMFIYINEGTFHDGEVVRQSYYRVTEQIDRCLSVNSPVRL